MMTPKKDRRRWSDPSPVSFYTSIWKPRSAPDAYIKLPDERAGLAFVFRVFDRVSYALIMRVTRPVRPLDVVQAP